MSTPIPLVMYHGDCPDGTTAAWVLWYAFKGRAEFKPLFYGVPFRAPTGPARPVFMVDFCLKTNAEMKTIQDFAAPHKFVVIDHHKDPGVPKAIEGLKDAVYVIGKSGARLTWEYLFPERPVPAIIAYTEDRDLWNWKLEHSQEVNAYLSSFPLNDPEAWDAVARELAWGFDKRDTATQKVTIAQGETILRFQEQCFKRAEARARLYDIPLPNGKSVRVKGANVAERAFSSEVAGRLAGDDHLGFTWFQREDGLFVFSLRRRRDGGLHMGELAKHLTSTLPGGKSGGGHPQAAGCVFDRLPIFLQKGYNVV